MKSASVGVLSTTELKNAQWNSEKSTILVTQLTTNQRGLTLTWLPKFKSPLLWGKRRSAWQVL